MIELAFSGFCEKNKKKYPPSTIYLLIHSPPIYYFILILQLAINPTIAPQPRRKKRRKTFPLPHHTSVVRIPQEAASNRKFTRLYTKSQPFFICTQKG